jgi:hypothetical protein
MHSGAGILFVSEESGPFVATTWEDSTYAVVAVWRPIGTGGGGLDFSLLNPAKRASIAAARSIAPGPMFCRQWKGQTGVFMHLKRKVIQDNDSAIHFITNLTKYNPHPGLNAVFKLLMSQHLSKPQALEMS